MTAGQAPDAFVDALGRRVAVAQPHAPAAEPVGVERGAGTYATRAVTARGSIALESRPSGRVTQT